MDGLDFGLREGILLLVVLVAAYLVFAVLRLLRLRRRPGPAAAAPVRSADPRPGAQHFVAPAESAPVPTPAAPFAEQLAWTALEAEVRQLRGEVAALREELAGFKAVRRVSPMYAEALDLARRGFDARGVAEECGISVAEAELVLAMARDKVDFDREVEDGGPGQHVAADVPGR
jgi:hypothetical protein